MYTIHGSIVSYINLCHHPGCEATCNGPYQGRWSKTMIGYGSEDTNFVLELTYNYGIDKYELGNDFLGIHINSTEIYEAIEGKVVKENIKGISSPDGYNFFIHNEAQGTCGAVSGVSLSSTNLEETVKFWTSILGLEVFEQSAEEVTLGFDRSQGFVRFVLTSEIDHAKGAGRIAFGVPVADIKGVEKEAIANDYKILTPFITLPTEGKADVCVVIFADPDGHEICFVGDEGFKDLSAFDPLGEKLLEDAITEDKSNEWFAKKGKSKGAA